jgi:hypothetical protein
MTVTNDGSPSCVKAGFDEMMAPVHAHAAWQRLVGAPCELQLLLCGSGCVSGSPTRFGAV